MAAFDTHQAVRRLTASGMDEAPAEAVVEVVDGSNSDLVTKGDLNLAVAQLTADLGVAVAQLTAEMHRALRVQGMWIVGMLTGLATIASLVIGTALVLIGVS